MENVCCAFLPSIPVDGIFGPSKSSEDDLVLPVASPRPEEFEQWMSNVKTHGMALKDAPLEIRHDKEIVLAAVRQNVFALKHASPVLSVDKHFILKVVEENGSALEHINDLLKTDDDVVTAAAEHYKPSRGNPQDKEEYEQWMSRIKSNGFELENAPEHIRNDKKIVLAAVRHPSTCGGALRFASLDCRNDRLIAMAAVRQFGGMLEYVSPELQNDKDVVSAAVQQNGSYLLHASSHLKDDKEVVMLAASQSQWALEFASPRLRNDKEVALVAVRVGEALGLVSEDMQKDKDVVLEALKHNPDSIKYAHEDIRRDRDALIAAGMFDADHDGVIQRRKKKIKKIVLSTRFSLKPTQLRSQATIFTKLLKEQSYIQEGGIAVYAPNAFDKKTCDKRWTSFWHPCRGTRDTCKYKNVLSESGRPTDNCCWRYSFRCQLEEAKHTGGFMLQLIEGGSLGDGQRIELDMAEELGIKIFHVNEPSAFGKVEGFETRHVDKVVAAIKGWYDEECRERSVCTIFPNGRQASNEDLVDREMHRRSFLRRSHIPAYI